MRRILTIIFVCLVAASCGMSRRVPVSQESTASLHAVSIDTSFIRRSIDSIVARMMSTAFNAEQMTDIELTRELFSSPDSSGKVHPEEKTVVRYSSRSRVNELSDVNEHSRLSAVEEGNSASMKDLNQEEKEGIIPVAESISAGRTPKSVKCLAWIGAAVLLVLAVWLLRKLRVI